VTFKGGQDSYGVVEPMMMITDISFIPRMLYGYGERRWNVIDRKNPKNSEKNLSQYHFVHHKSHMDLPGRDPGPPR
jgi:hypothetical protein